MQSKKGEGRHSRRLSTEQLMFDLMFSQGHKIVIENTGL